MQKRKLFIGADHAGFDLKEYIKAFLGKKDYELEDMGTYDKSRVDYPDLAKSVALNVRLEKNALGILICGTGIGISIAANKVPGIRAALCNDPRCARLSRNHNDANILVLGGRPYNKKKVKNIVNTWLASDFEGGRHLLRVNKIKRMEKEFFKR